MLKLLLTLIAGILMAMQSVEASPLADTLETIRPLLWH